MDPFAAYRKLSAKGQAEVDQFWYCQEQYLWARDKDPKEATRWASKMQKQADKLLKSGIVKAGHPIPKAPHVANPITSGKISIPEETPKGKARGPAWGWMSRKGVPEKIAAAVLAEMGWPQEKLGTGSFAMALVHSQDPDKVVKFTMDMADVGTAARLKAMVDEYPGYKNLALAVAPQVFEVYEVDFKHKKTGKDKKLGVIVIERVTPIGQGGEKAPDSNFLIAREFINTAARSGAIAKLQQLVYRRSKTGKPVTRKIFLAMIDALDDMASVLEYRAGLVSAGDWVRAGRSWGVPEHVDPAMVATILNNAAEKIRILIEQLEMPIIDLHSGNWGVRMVDGEPDLVIIDFGLSSGREPAEGEEISKTMLEVE